MIREFRKHSQGGRGRTLIASLLGLGLLVGGLLPVTPALAERPVTLSAPEEVTLVPEHYLRRWDPVTLFFDGREGPAGGGAEHHPERLVTMSPAHPGAWTWLDGRTLQFRPAEPWPPLTRFEWRFDGEEKALLTLFEAPVRTLPTNGASNLEPVQSLTLTFNQPVAPEALAEMLRVELRPLPGVDSGQSHWLDASDFTIKVLERDNPSAQASYVVNFQQPIPEGTHATVHLRLSLEEELDQAFARVSFATAPPFSATRLGCSSDSYPLTPEGVSYSEERAIRCSAERRELTVQFSNELRYIDPLQGRNLLRFTPTVPNLEFRAAGKTLTVVGDFQADTLYQVSLQPTEMVDLKGRALAMSGASSLYLFFPQRDNFLRWSEKGGIMERFGPQMLPLQGRGEQRLDLRIYPLDPLDRSFWPFPDRPVTVVEDNRPPGPGEAPEPFSETGRYISTSELQAQLEALGSPAISTLVELPLRRGSDAASFGLDLKPHLERLAGEAKPGSYLVGMRRLGSPNREWVRVQVTDLALTTVEERKRVQFYVSSLSTGEPVRGARVRVEASRSNNETGWETLVEGRTDGDGLFSWDAPGHQRYYPQVKRLVVEKGNDILVLDPSRPPQRFANNHWSDDRSTWLQWTVQSLDGRSPREANHCHLYTERPVYKPEEAVHIAGWMRATQGGKFRIMRGKGELVVNGPGNAEWRYPVSLSELGGFYHAFEEEELPTGRYTVRFVHESEGSCGSVSFNKEAYRLPRFEVTLNGPQRSGLDEPFKVLLNARYYAGGKVAGQPVRWRVTQFPYAWKPEGPEGFVYSTDSRFSGDDAFRSSPLLQQSGTTDEEGMAELSIDPTIEPTAQPRRYVVESTVVGADDQTVSSTHQVLALPPFVLGMKLPRYLEEAEAIEPEIIVVGHDGKPLAGQELTLRLLHRQWHSHLRATDFTQGDARYVTEVVETPIYEGTFRSEEKPLLPKLPIEQSGVYVVQLEARDRMGRTQLLSLDLFAGNGEPVSWSRPPAQTFKATPDQHDYAPGETAHIVLESPFQEGRALAIIEEPEGSNRYEWLEVENGSATLDLKLRQAHLPRLPVHFILMRGRIGDEPPRADELDLGKPATLATTTWVEVNDSANRITMKLEYPEKAQPGDEVEVTLTLRDHRGRPLAGEATVWLVDQAVLALGEEQRLDPLPDFIPHRDSFTTVHGTRNLTLGHLPLQQLPGGDGEGAAPRARMAAEADALMDNVTVRQNFRSVAFYQAGIRVGDDGRVTLKMKLPDNLTNFELRAKAVAGAERFGFAKGRMAVRLPVIVQPSLPRFVRPGDSFDATAIGRIVDGDGGAGLAAIRVDGLEVAGQPQQRFEWQTNRPQRIDFRLSVPTPGYTEQGRPERDEVSVRVAVERQADKGRDAFEVKLPLLPDRRPLVRRQLAELAAGESLEVAAIDEPVREGTLQRTLLLSDQPALVRMAAGLSYLMDYPHGCTEQRLSRARVYLGGERLDQLLQQEGDYDERKRAVQETIDWIDRVAHDDGTVGYWPGSDGYVSVTAWSTIFLIEARDGGFTVSQPLLQRMLGALKRSLRGDYRGRIFGGEYIERVWALYALARAGQIDAGYAAELARKSDYLNLESTALLAYALTNSDSATPAMQARLNQRMWDGVVVQLHQGRETYGGLQSWASAAPRQVLPSETRTLSHLLRAVTLDRDGDAEGSGQAKQLLLDAIVTLGQGDGWGSTNANASALLALTEALSQGVDTPVREATLTVDGQERTLKVGGDTPLQRLALAETSALRLTVVEGETERPLSARVETRYLPAAPGSEQAAEAAGFVLRRELQLVQSGRSEVGEPLPARRIALEEPGMRVEMKVGQVVEEHLELVNPEERHFVAVIVPLAAGMEPLNPALATAPPEAKPAGSNTLAPSYVAFLDDHMAYYYDALPKGTYHFYFRTRATIPGEFTQPAAYAEMMYQEAINGNGNGARIIVSADDGK